jgi:hypothetical protein
MRHSLRTGREELTVLRFAILGGDYCTAAAGNSNPRSDGERAGRANSEVSAQLEPSKPASQVVNNPYPRACLPVAS